MNQSLNKILAQFNPADACMGCAALTLSSCDKCEARICEDCSDDHQDYHDLGDEK